MEYQQALARLKSLTSFGIQPGLSRIEELLQQLGHPQGGETPRYLHIAGTNGKGSVAAMLAAMLEESGAKTGLFTSPHLFHHCERYRINGQMMQEAEFAALYAEVDAAILAMQEKGFASPTEFEAVTALALLWFARAQVDWAVMECGLGGRLDSTNVILPCVSAITNIGLDHMDYLGSTVKAIAAEKAGIIKPEVPLVTAAEGSALSVLRAAAEKAAAPIYVYEEDFHAEGARFALDGVHFSIRTRQRLYADLHLPLLGRHQLPNAALAVQIAELAGLPEAAIRSGLEKTQWPGRLEIVSQQPLIVLDGAHNEAGMRALAESLRTYWPGKRICCLLGMLADKEREKALAHLLPLLSEAVVTPPPYLKRVGDWQHIVKICCDAGVPATAIEENDAALCFARERAKQADLLLICGSLYLVGELRGRWFAKEAATEADQ